MTSNPPCDLPAAPSHRPAPGAAAGAAAGLDAEAMGRLHELDPDGRNGVVGRVLVAYQTSLARMLAQLQTQREGGDAALVSRVAHTLKSSSASVGALALSAACADVEARLRTGADGELSTDVDRLLAEGQAAMAAVGAMLQRNSPGR